MHFYKNSQNFEIALSRLMNYYTCKKVPFTINSILSDMFLLHFKILQKKTSIKKLLQNHSKRNEYQSLFKR